jgi:hypothetical protein
MLAETATPEMQEIIRKGVKDAIDNANTRGWEAVVLVFVMFGLLCVMAFIFKWFVKSIDKRQEENIKREERMAVRLSQLETFVQTTLVQLVNDASAMTAKVLDAVSQLTNALNTRPCLLDQVGQDEILDRLVAKLKEVIER